jgi:formamidopyrimidine-DNA glycosylase
MGRMPELPDVEGFRRTLASCAQGRRIERVHVADAGVLHGVTARRFRDRLRGRTFGEPARHGKWLLAPLGPGEDGPTLLLHFGMTGRLVCCAPHEAPHRHDRVTFTVDGRELRYRDMRKLRGLWLADGPPDSPAAAHVMGRQGPDAADLDRDTLTEALTGRRGGLKSALMNQSVLAGLGNLLVDETLWRARLHPAHPAGDLSGDELRRLHTALRRAVRDSAKAGRVPDRPSWLTGHRDEPDPHCPRCHTALRRTRVAGRTTVWCPHCQPQ